MHLETEQIPNPRYAEIQSSLDALTKSVGDIEAGITVTFSDGVTPVTMEYLTNEINNAHYRLSITSRCITVNHGYGQLYPLVKRIDYERTIQEMARETKAELSVCNKTCSLALTVGWLQNTSLGMTISV